jgi:hypothetical protein
LKALISSSFDSFAMIVLLVSCPATASRGVQVRG